MANKRDTQVEVIVYKIVNGSAQFLILKRALDRGGFWQPITGGVEEGEDLRAAALREMEEETQITHHIKVLEDIHSFEFEFNGGYGKATEHVFGVQVDPDAEAIISDEHTEQKWCSLDEALSLIKYESNKVGFRKIDQLY